MLKGEKLYKVFESGFIKKKKIVAVDGVDIEIKEGETLALVGESGSGKSTLGRLLLMLIKPTRGRIIFDGMDITSLKPKELRKIRTKMQLIPQHPDEAMDPRWKIFDSIAEPLKIHGIDDFDRVYELIDMVGLKEEHLDRFPHELSGGELQRAAIARALALNPKFVVCDEPTSMLDVSVQAQILRLLMDLQRKLGIAYLFITHDLEVAEFMADRIAVMYAGQIVEEGYAEKVLGGPVHPYTRALVESLDLERNTNEVESTEPRKVLVAGVEENGKECKYYQCPYRSSKCSNIEVIGINGRRVRCVLAE